jgi:hypothetical protein
VLSQDTLMLVCLTLAPIRRKLFEQLDLSLESQSAAVLCFDSVRQLVRECQIRRDALEDAVEQLVEVTCGEA